jgi:hypothetical protein
VKTVTKTPEERLLKRFGSQQAIADVVGCTRQCVNNWFLRGGISHKGALILSGETGYSVSSLLVRWNPKSKRVHTAKDAQKKLRAERTNKSKSKRGT